jgi:hypothetical protein
VAFTYLSPMVGIYSLFVLGLVTGGPGYVWLTWLPVAGMLLVGGGDGEAEDHEETFREPVAPADYPFGVPQGSTPILMV